MTIFNHLDKFVLEVVEDNDILAYQAKLTETVGGEPHQFQQDVYFIQPFFTSKSDVNVFVRKYKTWQSS